MRRSSEPERVRCPAAAPEHHSFSGSQCGLWEGHSGNHTVLIPSSENWSYCASDLSASCRNGEHRDCWPRNRLTCKCTCHGKPATPSEPSEAAEIVDIEASTSEWPEALRVASGDSVTAAHEWADIIGYLPRSYYSELAGVAMESAARGWNAAQSVQARAPLTVSQEVRVRAIDAVLLDDERLTITGAERVVDTVLAVLRDGASA